MSHVAFAPLKPPKSPQDTNNLPQVTPSVEITIGTHSIMTLSFL